MTGIQNFPTYRSHNPLPRYLSGGTMRMNYDIDGS